MREQPSGSIILFPTFFCCRTVMCRSGDVVRNANLGLQSHRARWCFRTRPERSRVSCTKLLMRCSSFAYSSYRTMCRNNRVWSLSCGGWSRRCSLSSEVIRTILANLSGKQAPTEALSSLSKLTAPTRSRRVTADHRDNICTSQRRFRSRTPCVQPL